ncbi:hypothetical protein D3C85_1110720 [compost metagenome]
MRLSPPGMALKAPKAGTGGRTPGAFGTLKRMRVGAVIRLSRSFIAHCTPSSSVMPDRSRLCSRAPDHSSSLMRVDVASAVKRSSSG